MLNEGKIIVVNSCDSEETRVAILEDGKLSDISIERMWERQRSGEIYKAFIDNILPGMNAAFVNLGDGRNAFLYLAEVKEDVKQGQPLLVQVTKVARKSKGARVTTKLSIPGRYIVLAPNGKNIGISRRIVDEEERSRLRDIAKEIKPENHGLIVRTVAVGVDRDTLKADLDYLAGVWDEIERQAKSLTSPTLLYRDLGLIGRVLRDELNEDVREIVVDGDEDYEDISDLVSRYCRGASAPEVTFYKGITPLFELYGIERDIEAALERKVWLSSGGYLVIDQTEAFTIIDVNTGRYVGGNTLEETILHTNLEAAVEIARQLKLRAIGGIVVIDFIDMNEEANKKLLVERLEELLKGDRCRSRVFSVTQLGLVEITRKRNKMDIKATFTRGCPFCNGKGWVLREDVIALGIKRFLQKICKSSFSEALVVDMSPGVADYVHVNCQSAWEEEFGRKIFIRSCDDFSWSKYRLEAQGPLLQIEHRINIQKSKEKVGCVYRTN